jgi:hypothetical protein
VRSPTESLTRRGPPPLQVGRGCSATGTAADSGTVTPLLPSKVVARHSMPTPGGEGDTALSDGSQNGIGICASDHVVVIITARIWWSATSTREQ